MFFRKLFRYPSKSRCAIANARQALAAAAKPIVEGLESRRLMSADTYYLPASTTFVELRANSVPGKVDVYLNHSTTSSYTFSHPTGYNDVIDAGGQSVTCVDKVPGADKPQPGSGPALQFTNAGTGSGLEIDASATDVGGLVTSSTASSTITAEYDS